MTDTAADVRRVPRIEAEDRLEPLYPATRLFKHAVVDAARQREEAAKLLADARAQAEQLLDQARREAEQLRHSAAGQAREQAMQQLAPLLVQAAQQVEAVSRSAVEEITQLAFRIAREVIDVEFAVQPQRIAELAQRAIEHVRTRFPQRVLVHVHPDDLSVLQAERERFAALVPRDLKLKFVADADLTPHALQVETELGHYAFSFEHELEQLREQMQRG